MAGAGRLLNKGSFLASISSSSCTKRGGGGMLRLVDEAEDLKASQRIFNTHRGFFYDATAGGEKQLGDEHV